MISARRLALSGALLAGPVAMATAPGLWPGCPVMALTGLPCPTCGGTRAIHLLLEGDSDFARYNAFWAVALVVAWAAAAVLLWRRLRGWPALGPRPGEALAWVRARPAAITGLAVAVATAGWVTAMVNLETIRPV